MSYAPADLTLMQRLWDDARNARLSEFYYGEQVTKLTKWNGICELVVALTAAGSGISGLALWHTDYGAVVWAFIAALAAGVAAAKPVLGFDQKIKSAAQQQQTYRSIFGALENLAFEIQQSGEVRPEQHRRYLSLRENLRAAEEVDDPHATVAALSALQKRVADEMPAERLWVPQVAAGSV